MPFLLLLNWTYWWQSVLAVMGQGPWCACKNSYRVYMTVMVLKKSSFSVNLVSTE